jgi:hypothetical protein
MKFNENFTVILFNDDFINIIKFEQCFEVFISDIEINTNEYEHE